MMKVQPKHTMRSSHPVHALLCACTLALALIPGTASADLVLFQDDFSGSNTDPLNDTIPDITTNSTTWVADVEYKADGAAASGQASRRAYLTLGGLIDDNRGNPDALYTLSATLDVAASTSTLWEAIGFWNESAPAENFGSVPSNGTAWMLRRANAQLKVFRGLRSTNGLTESTATPNNVAGKVDLKVILDLTSWNGTSSYGTVTYFAKLSTDPAYTEIVSGALDATNSSFRAVGLGGGTVNAQFDSFELSKWVAPAITTDLVLFEDDFSGLDSDPLDGTTPDITQGSTAWVADPEYTADGSAAINAANPSRRAYLTLGGLIDDNRGNPDAIYALSARVSVVAGTTAIWEAIGFWDGDTPVENFASVPSNGTAWMLRRDNAQLRVFRGPRATKGLIENTASPNNIAGAVDLKVVLDLSSWNGNSSFGNVTYFAKLATDLTYTRIAFGLLDATNSTFRAVGLGGGGVVAAQVDFLQLSKSPDTSPTLTGFTYDRSHPDGASQVSIKGAPGSRFKLVEADDLNFTNPDQNPVPLTGATVGTLDGNEVILDANGNATLQFDLGISKSATFIRAQSIP